MTRPEGSGFTLEEVRQAIEESIPTALIPVDPRNTAMLAMRLVGNMPRAGIVLDIWRLGTEESVDIRFGQGVVSFFLLAPERRMRLERPLFWMVDEVPLNLPQFPDWVLVEGHNVLLTPNRRRDFSLHTGPGRGNQQYYKDQNSCP